MNNAKKNMNTNLPKGVYPVMMTAFNENGSIDFQGVNHLTDYYLQAGINGLFACAMSAEVNHLDDNEKVELAENIVRHVNGRVPVVAGALSADPMTQQIELARRISGTGADIVTVAVSQIAKENENDQVWLHNMDLFLQVLPDNIRLGLYESPWPYRRVLSDCTFQWVVQSGRFYFLKDTCSQINTIKSRLEAIRNSSLIPISTAIRNKPDTEIVGLSLFNANTQTLLLSLQAGAQGFSGIGANYFPNLYVWLCRNFKKFPEMSRDLQKFLTECCDIIEGKFYPVIAKEYLRQQSIPITPFCRSKHIELPEDMYEKMRQLHTEADEWMKKIR